MNIEWLVKESNPKVVVFVLGWASGSFAIRHIRPQGCDVVCVSDYRADELYSTLPHTHDDNLHGASSDSYGGELSGTPSDTYAGKLAAAGNKLKHMLSSYEKKYLFAWSFGVWVAERIFAGVSFDRSVALNGTSFPVDELYGIEPRRMAVTIRGIASGGLSAFNRRAYADHYDTIFADQPQRRTPAEYVRELSDLSDGSQSVEGRPYSDDNAGFRWDKAIVGEHDLIFPPENMKRYWGELAESLPLPHYPFGDPQIVTEEIEGR